MPSSMSSFSLLKGICLMFLVTLGAQEVLSQPTTQATAGLNTTGQHKAAFPFKDLGNARMYGGEFMKKMVDCITRDSSLSEDRCVKKLILRAQSMNSDNNTLATFYNETEILLKNACDPECAQNYNTAMRKIVEGCVPKFVEAYTTRFPNATSRADAITRASYEVGYALPDFIRATACEKDAQQELCTVQFLHFAQREKLMIQPPKFTNATFANFGGLSSLLSAVNVTAIDLLGAKPFCTACNMKIVQKTETFLATKVVPQLHVFSPNANTVAKKAHTMLVDAINSACGAGSVRSSLPNEEAKITAQNVEVKTPVVAVNSTAPTSSASPVAFTMLSMAAAIFSLAIVAIL